MKERVRPICIPVKTSHRTRSYVGSMPFIAGWGKLIDGGDKGSEVLMEVQVPVVDNEECKERYRRLGQLKLNRQFNERIMCAGHLYGGHDSCQGDSGGPLMLPIHDNRTFPFYQIGIIFCEKKKQTI